MMQKIDYRFELSTLNVADNPLHVDRNANKKTVIFDPIPNCIQTVFEQYSKPYSKTYNFLPTVIKLYLNSIKTVKTLFEDCSNTVLTDSEILSKQLFPLPHSHLDIYQILFASLSVRGAFFWFCKRLP